MIFLYKTIINILFIIVLPFLPVIYFFSEKRRASMLPRFGFRTGLKPKQAGKKRIWIHALSLGEVISSLPFVKVLKEQYKDLDIVFTVSFKIITPNWTSVVKTSPEKMTRLLRRIKDTYPSVTYLLNGNYVNLNHLPIITSPISLN